MAAVSQYVPRVSYMLGGWPAGISEPSTVAPSLQNVTWLHKKKHILKYLERPIKITSKNNLKNKNKTTNPSPKKKPTKKKKTHVKGNL